MPVAASEEQSLCPMKPSGSQHDSFDKEMKNRLGGPPSTGRPACSLRLSWGRRYFGGTRKDFNVWATCAGSTSTLVQTSGPCCPTATSPKDEDAPASMFS